MVRDTCDTNDGHTGRSYLLIQRNPQMRQGALLSLEPEDTSIKREFLTLQAAPADSSDKPPELSKAHAPKEVPVQMTAILLKGFDQLIEELLTLLVP